MKYRYNHKEILKSHGIFRCEECQGDGYFNVSRDLYGESIENCYRCKGTGMRLDEFIGIEWKLIKRRHERIAA